MRTLLNIIWFIFGGFWLALTYVLLGVLMCILIITIPWGIASFRIASYVIWPFGRTVVSKPNKGVGSTIGNIIWIILAGIPIVIAHLTTALAQAITIIGIPLAIANLKIIPISFAPLGKDIVPVSAIPAGTDQVYNFTI